MLTALYSKNIKVWEKKPGDGEPALANMVPPTQATYEMTILQEYLATAVNDDANYYRVLAHNEPADDAKEPADETKYDETFGIDFLRYGDTVKAKKGLCKLIYRST